MIGEMVFVLCMILVVLLVCMTTLFTISQRIGRIANKLAPPDLEQPEREYSWNDPPQRDVAYRGERGGTQIIRSTRGGRTGPEPAEPPS